MTELNNSGMAEKAASGVDSLQLIDGQGRFDAAGLDAFVKHIRLSECGLSYAVVAIMGPQSSGKSTLLNHLFKTSFREMDAYTGRSQTTQGVWVARAAGIQPCTIVMDLEGTDGRERGEDDTAFEKQSALFALAVADVVIINMWCHDIGREHAANKPLLKIVFQVMMRLFTPRKTTLLFVIRDKTRTPMEILEPTLRDDVQKIWESAPKPQSFEGTEISDCFNVQVTSLSNYEEKPEMFKDQVADLRERFQNSITPGGLAGDRRVVVPGTGFPVSTKSIWKIIKDNRDLDLPAHKVMVATVRCEEIAHEKLTDFLQNQEWIELKESAERGEVNGFGTKLNLLLNKYISEYDQEVSYFDENVRTSKRNFLVSQALESVNPVHQAILSHHRNGALNRFKLGLKEWADLPDGGEGFATAVRQCSEAALSDFDKGVADAQVSYAQWDASKIREKLQRDIDAHASAVRTEQIRAIVSASEKMLEENVGQPTGALLDSAAPDTWSAIRDLLDHEVNAAQSSLLRELSGYELEKAEERTLVHNLANFGRSVVESEAKTASGQALLRMKDWFTTHFSHDSESLPRLWSENDDIRSLARDARCSSLKGLSVLAAVRLDEKTNDGIETALTTLLGDSQEQALSKSANVTSDGKTSLQVHNPLAASSWDGIDTDHTLLTPTQCKSIWRQFKAETDFTISQALSAQESHRGNKSWLPPPWAMAAIVVLGFNEFMALLRNPLYLLVFFVVYLLGRALWVQLDVGAEFRHGVMPGVLSLSSKFLPTVMNTLTKLAEAGSNVGGGHERSSFSSTSSTPQNRSHTELQDLAEEVEYSNVTDSNGPLRNRQPRKLPEYAN
ncbi:unnamed protein product [Calypogeia fissa]